MKAILAHLALLAGAAALPRPHRVVEQIFAAPSDEAKYHKALFGTHVEDTSSRATEHQQIDNDLTIDAVLAPFVQDARFGWPFVNVHENGGASTQRYDAEGSPETVADALRILHDDALSFTLKYEQLDVAEWPAALAALLPPALRAELTTGNLKKDGGLTVHAYLSAPGASALPEHGDVGDILVLHLAGKKEWNVDGTDVTMAPGDGLWMPAGTRHSARAMSSGVSAHLTIHRVNDVSKERRLNHIPGIYWDDRYYNDGDDDDYRVLEDDYCGFSPSSDNDFGIGCPCNMAVGCNDASGYCLTGKDDRIFDYAREDKCCGINGEMWCQRGDPGDTPKDTEDWVSLDGAKSCAWVGKKPGERCRLNGVVLRYEFHYGKKWLIANSPRFKAQDACPISCAGSGGSSSEGGDVKLKRKKCKSAKKDKSLKKWSYDAGLGDEVGCAHVAADNTDKRCARIGTKGLPAKDACCKTCAAYDCTEFGSSGVRCDKGEASDSDKDKDTCKKKAKKCKSGCGKDKKCKKLCKKLCK